MCGFGGGSRLLARLRGLETCDDPQRGVPSSAPPRVSPTRRDTADLVARILLSASTDPGRIAAYLRHRGLRGTVPAALRYVSALPYYNEDGRVTGRYPAMVAAVQRADGELIGVHRTYLDGGGPGKAPVPTPKKSLGPVRGGAVRLAEAADVLALAEGIETALAVMQATGTPTWATISASGMVAVRLPRTVRTVEIWADHDRGQAGQDAAQQLAAHLRREGRRSCVFIPPTVGTDWLDALVTDGEGALQAARRCRGRASR